jgi:uncharacterized membrane protein YraQ (UPF0718 family)
MESILRFLDELFRLSVEMAPYLLLGLVIAGVLNLVVSRGWVAGLLGRHNSWSVVKAALIGIPLPVCSCGVLPLAASLRKNGASPAAIVAFLVATPVTGVDSILATYALLGGTLAVLRPALSLAVALMAGFLMLWAVRERGGPPGRGALPGAAEPARSRAPRVLAALRYGLVELLGDISRPVLLGLLLGALISTFIPDGLLTHTVGQGFLSYLAMVVVGVPLYVCATGSIPIAAALMAKGLSAGAAMAFLLAGPATNAVAVVVARQIVGRRGVAVYLGTIVVGSVLAGMATDALAGVLGASAPSGPIHAGPGGHAGLLSVVAAFVLWGLLAYHLARPLMTSRKPEEEKAPRECCKSKGSAVVAEPTGGPSRDGRRALPSAEGSGPSCSG